MMARPEPGRGPWKMAASGGRVVGVRVTAAAGDGERW